MRWFASLSIVWIVFDTAEMRRMNVVLMSKTYLYASFLKTYPKDSCLQRTERVLTTIDIVSICMRTFEIHTTRIGRKVSLKFTNTHLYFSSIPRLNFGKSTLFSLTRVLPIHMCILAAWSFLLHMPNFIWCTTWASRLGNYKANCFSWKWWWGYVTFVSTRLSSVHSTNNTITLNTTYYYTKKEQFLNKKN